MFAADMDDLPGFLFGGLPPGFGGKGCKGGKFGGSGGKGRAGGDDDPVDDSDDDDGEEGDKDASNGRARNGQQKNGDNTRLYELLSVEKDASPAEIKKAYHKMAMRHHPDKGGDSEHFKDIQKAFEVLGDPDRRRRYDRLGEAGLEDEPSSPDMFQQFFGGSSSSQRGRPQRQRTKDIVRPVWVTLEDLYNGVTKRMPVTRKVVADADSGGTTCEACNGQGVFVQIIRMPGLPMAQQIRQQCPRCDGTGTSAQMKSAPELLSVFVEKGSPDGHKITLHGKADEAPGCDSGDVIAVVRQQEHPRFLRRGADLFLEHELSLAEALTGYRIVVPHLDGRTLVVHSNPGEVVMPRPGSAATIKAVEGGGMPIHRDPFKFGNLFLVFTIRFPTSLELPLASELRRLLGAEPLPAEEHDVEIRHGSKERAGVDQDVAGTEVEHCYVTDVDPYESAQRPKVGGEAYNEDEDRGMPGVQCQQQ
eukprot:TRINITY_DN74224_c0_g1_i1.p1 TRINITY_DN74224_c0_g1~~TRINITY_DN74224_c0_g1_i1.p1  ORF type:complete len:475 (-),score=92.05 TRINITY_DN74224_c0_g1_i1:121-1545(-)